MAQPYCCPNCKTNKTRFNLIEQHAKIVKLDSNTGEIISEHTKENIEPYHMLYMGPSLKIQCGVCGLLEDEEMFIKYATYRGKEST
ncbi:DNA alkylation repair protein [Pseudogracilibacillus auburnensis]|uniref:DNA alkylation repair protein n=1 Tax=Pseudogracilibacillus auburnensis TaxID=1494959 RepID=UPI001A96D965|nr:DNA alkylation repair protein [Pseudogracilibacillus auburnensis]MBO1004230.1 DNA alkylation repair protein [Pseudogracilibacillus auburnensis]